MIGGKHLYIGYENGCVGIMGRPYESKIIFVYYTENYCRKSGRKYVKFNPIWF